MLSIVGFLVVVFGVLGGFMMAGGHLATLIQPSEFVTLGGAAIGGMLICTPGYTLSAAMKKVPKVFGAGVSSQDFMDILPPEKRGLYGGDHFGRFRRHIARKRLDRAAISRDQVLVEIPSRLDAGQTREVCVERMTLRPFHGCQDV